MPVELGHSVPPDFPSTLYIATYDILGNNQATGQEKLTRKTGIVTHTHQLIDGLSQINPSLEITVSQTGSPEEGAYNLTTPEGQTVALHSIGVKHPVLDDPATGRVSPARVTHYYETDIHNPDNPIWDTYARQYAQSVQQANSPYILLQNPNPLVGLLKAEQFGHLDGSITKQLQVTTVLHDTGTYPRRFQYIGDRLRRTSMDIAFVAISQSVHGYLKEVGVPEELITFVPNGINIERFDARMERAKKLGAFACVQERDGLPKGKKLILCTAPRVRLKGYQVIIEAARILKEQGRLTDAYMAFAGKNMSDTKSVNHTEELEASIQEKGLSDDVFLLDTVDPDELAGCYGEAYVSLLASTHPEGLPYTNFEAMLAGSPLITTRLGGPLDYMVHGENGLFVEPGDPVDLAHAINTVLSSPELHAKLVQNGRRTAEQYSLERMVHGYARVIARGHILDR